MDPLPQVWNGIPLRFFWAYRDQTGKVLGIVARYDRAAEAVNGQKPDKVVIPFFRRNGNCWAAGALPAPRPLFGLAVMAAHPDEAVIVVEGEKCGAALHSLGLVAVSVQGGSKAAGKADWSPLSGHRKVVILPDFDQPGSEYALAVVDALKRLTEPPDVAIVRLPGLPEAGDVVDWLQARCPGWDGFQPIPEADRERLAAELRNALDDARLRVEPPPDPDWPELLPLRRATPPPEPFPLPALGPLLMNAAQAIGDVIQSPLALIGNSLLAGAALAVQGHADLEIDGRLFPVSLYVVTVADTGERKTATDNVVLAPHEQRQRELRQQYENALSEYELKLAAWKKAREECLSSKQNKTLQAKQDALQDLGKEPTEPVNAVLMVEEPTYEGLVKGLAVGWPSMGLFSDEGGRFLGGYAMNSDNLLKTVSGLSKIWDGKHISRSRGGDGNTVLYGRRLSLHLMIQPAVSHLLFGNELLIGQGLLSRCLVAWPETNIGKHRYQETRLSDLPAMVRYAARLAEILATPLPLADGSLHELNPRALPLAPGAKARFVEFHDHISALCAPDGALHPIKGLAAKGAEHAARLAGVLTLVDDLRAPAVGDDAMEAGIALAQFYLAEALRLFGAAAENPDLELAERCLAWARGRGVPLTLPDLYQKGPNPVSNRDKAALIVAILEKHGWIRRLPGGAEVDGKRRRDAWEVRP